MKVVLISNLRKYGYYSVIWYNNYIKCGRGAEMIK